MTGIETIKLFKDCILKFIVKQFYSIYKSGIIPKRMATNTIHSRTRKAKWKAKL